MNIKSRLILFWTELQEYYFDRYDLYNVAIIDNILKELYSREEDSYE